MKVNLNKCVTCFFVKLQICCTSLYSYLQDGKNYLVIMCGKVVLKNIENFQEKCNISVLSTKADFSMKYRRLNMLKKVSKLLTININ